MTIKRKVLSSNVAIVVPVYKSFKLLEKFELKLFAQIKTVFSSREVLIILPESLENDWNQNSGFKIVSFKDAYFKDKFSYSKLFCKKEFYESFSNFDYIQIIQTDCWIFNDNLDYFTNLDYDYFGAPWMEGGFDGYPEEKLWKTGNGGFSFVEFRLLFQSWNKLNLVKKGKCPFSKLSQILLKP